MSDFSTVIIAKILIPMVTSFNVKIHIFFCVAMTYKRNKAVNHTLFFCHIMSADIFDTTKNLYRRKYFSNFPLHGLQLQCKLNTNPFIVAIFGTMPKPDYQDQHRENWNDYNMQQATGTFYSVLFFIHLEIKRTGEFKCNRIWT